MRPRAEASSGQIVGMRRLTESQYRNTISDIFGPDITVAGRFEPIVRPVQHLLATGASSAAISPVGLEQFDGIARTISAQVFDVAHRDAFVKCTPADIKKADDKCARKVLIPIGRYVFRRPLTAKEQDSYVGMANEGATTGGSFYEGLELSLAAMLVSPNFLYVIETAEPDPGRPGGLRLDNYSRASRLSFLLWDSTPNEKVLTAAAKGRLTNQSSLDRIVGTMVASPRLEDGVRAFFTDMLIYDKFEDEDFAKDPVTYPLFNADVAKALPEQMLRMIVDEVVVRDSDYRELFTTRRTFMTRTLGPLYGVPVHSTSGWEPYEFEPGSERAGLLGQAGFLALYSHSGRSSPTIRGRAIREVLLCQPVPNPPGNVDFKVVQDTTNKALPTARDRLTSHRDNPVCAGCHRITDPLGLTLENFDGIGAYRDQENAHTIDVASNFDGQEIMGVVGLGKGLAASEATTKCVANRALEYATGRSTEHDAAALTTVTQNFAASGYRIRSLFQQVATMPATFEVSQNPDQAAPIRTTVSLSTSASNGAAR